MPTDDQNKRNVAAIYEQAAAGRSQESFTLLLNLFASDGVVHAPPTVPWAGEYSGPDMVIEMF